MAQRVKEYELVISEKIRNEIENSDYVVAIITTDTRESASVNQELGYAQGKGASIIIMLEKTAKVGVLTYGLETEEFERTSFRESCRNIRKYLIEKGTEKRLSKQEISWIKENVYTPLYNTIMKIKENPDRFTKLPPDLYGDLTPIAKLRIESDVKELLLEFSNEIERWKQIALATQNGFSINLDRLGSIVHTAFEKAGFMERTGMIKLDDYTSQEPRHWLDSVKFIIFDNSITDEHQLYEKILNYVIIHNNSHQRFYQNWKSQKPIVYSHILNVIPQLRSEFKIVQIFDEIAKQNKLLDSILNKIVSKLEEKLVRN